jgi:anaerobic selenocysteine-containing dehydrogenase
MSDYLDSDPHSRREFLRLMGASLAASSLAGCIRPPQETIVPHVEYPEYSPSETLQFATAMPRGGYGLGVLATSRGGRPTKLEGNPLHPASLGATDAFAQASILGLYDPDRSQTVVYRGTIDTWERFLTEMAAYAQQLKDRRGEGLRILTETVTSPTLRDQLLALLDELPRAVWHQYEPAGLHNVREGCRLAFERYVQPRWRLDRADVTVSLDSDFLVDLPGSVRYVREFIDRRRVVDGAAAMNRLYVLESTPTITGARADHRWPIKPSLVAGVARALLARVRGQQSASDELGVPAAWLSALAEDLESHRGSGLVIAGPGQPPQVQAVVWALNAALENIGRTVTLHEPVEARPENHRESLAKLVAAMQAGEVETLVILGGNPVYATPRELDFAAALSKVKQRIHLSEYDDETSFQCDWHIPAAHYLESWSDVRAFDGTATIIQPLIEPLYGGRTAHEVVALLRGQTGRSAYQIVQDHWQSVLGERDFPSAWRRALHDGVVAGTEAAEVAA